MTSDLPVKETNRTLLGVSLILVGVFLISLQDSVIKFYTGDFTLWQIFALRGLFALPLLAVITFYNGGHQAVRASLATWSLVRAFCITLTLLSFYATLPFLSLASIAAANYIAPIFVALLSAFVIGERVSKLGWCGVGLGFIGVLVLLRPGSDAFSPWVLLPVMGAAFYAVGHIVTRAKCQEFSMATLALSMNLVMCGAGWAMSIILFLWPLDVPTQENYGYLFGSWGAMGFYEWGLMALFGAFAACVSILIAGAYQVASPPIVATFEYAYLLFAAGWDWLVFDQIPSLWGAVGIVCVVVAGLMVLRRNSPNL